MQERDFSTDEPVALRNALMTLPGVGPKTASWIVRNWLGSDEVAILDIHIVRAGILAGLFEPDEDVSKNYIRMEAQFIAFSRALGVQTSDLDALIWRMMRTTPRLVMHLIELNSSLHLRCPLGPE
jgi:thermostable 8-oxoguanine DNA glycosylase